MLCALLGAVLGAEFFGVLVECHLVLSQGALLPRGWRDAVRSNF
jgi:hypothetical protein